MQGSGLQIQAAGLREDQFRSGSLAQRGQVDPHLFLAELPPQCSRQHSRIRRGRKFADTRQVATFDGITFPLMDDVGIRVSNPQ